MQKLFLLWLLILLIPITLKAQAPANDDPCNATPLTPNSSCSFQVVNNNNATNTAGAGTPSCGGTNPGEEDIWFTIVVPASGNVIIDTDTGTLQNIAMAVYSAPSCTGPFTEIVCDENGSGNNMPQVSLTGQTPGTTLYVRVWDIFEPGIFGIGADPREQGTFSICFVAPPPPPFNDEPCQAITLIPSSTCNPMLADNIDALNTTAPTPSCGGTNPGVEDVWFVLQAPASGAVVINTSAGTLNNMAMAAYSATSCNGSLTEIDCNDNGLGMPSLNLSGLTPGSYIFIRLWDEYSPGVLGIGVDPRQQGTFSICAIISNPINTGGSGSTGTYNCASTPPAGNTCSQATPICTFDGYCGSTSGYTPDYWFSGSQGLGGPLNANGIFCGSIENNSFITFIASSSSVNLDVIVSGSSTSCDEGVQFMMFGDPTGAPACNSLSIVDYGCQSPMAPGTNNFVANNLIPGQQYYLMVDGFAGDICNYQINAISGVLVGVSAGADRNICLGESVNLTVYGAGPGTVNWSGPFLNSTSGTTVTATPTSTGTYQYIVTAPTIDSACGGPTSSDTVVVTVGGQATVNITATGCNNGQTTLVANGANNYTWIPPAEIDQTSGNTVVVSPSSPTTYVVYGSNASGCVVADSITVGPGDIANIQEDTFCVSDPATALTLAGTSGGTWSGSGITNSTNGTFDPGIAGLGSHQIIYTTTGSCAAADTATILVTSGATASINNSSFCVADAASNLSVTGTQGGTWSGTGIIDVNNGTFDPAVAGVGSHTITYSIAGGCGTVASASITVTASDVATITPASFCLSQPPANLTVTGTQGGTWTGTGITDGVNGTFDPATAGIGTHQVIYSTSGTCATADTIQIAVTNSSSATINLQNFCLNDRATALTVTGSQGGVWSGTGITDSLTGTFNPAIAGIGTYQIIYSLSGACATSDTTNITVNANDQASIDPAGFCLAQPSTNLTVTGTQGGVWTGTGITNTNTGTFDPATAGVGTHQIIYTTSSTCPTADTIQVIVTANATADIQEDTFCLNDPAVTMQVMGSTGGTWNGPGVLFGTDTFDPAVAGTGSHQIIYTVSGACPASDTATFIVNAQDVANIDPQGSPCINDPIISLTVTGTQGGSWSGPGVFFGSSSFNPALAGAGSHLIIYQSNGNCPAADSITISVTNGDSADIQESTFCGGTGIATLTVTGTTGGSWSGTGIVDSLTGSFDPALAGEGSHWIYYSTNGACAATDSALIVVGPVVEVNPYITQPGNTFDTITLGNSAELFAQASNSGLAFSWTANPPADAGIANPNAEQTSVGPSGPGTYIYQILASSTIGNLVCSDSGTVTLVVTDDGVRGIPDAFTPGETPNEIFRPIGYEAAEVFTFRVYNRWGQVVYDNTNAVTNQNTGWDGTYKGKDQPREVYIYVMEYQFPWENEPSIIRGQLTLLR